jgi:hypothetical protein
MNVPPGGQPPGRLVAGTIVDDENLRAIMAHLIQDAVHKSRLIIDRQSREPTLRHVSYREISGK